MEQNTKSDLMNVIAGVFRDYEIILNDTLGDKLIVIVPYCTETLQRVFTFYMLQKYNNFRVNVIDLHNYNVIERTGFIITIEDKKQ